MDLTQILESIPEKKLEDIENPKFQLEDAVKIHPTLTLDCEYTYYLFLSKRPDLTKDERDVIYQIIAKLKANDDLEYSHYMKNMRDADVFFNEEKPTNIIIE